MGILKDKKAYMMFLLPGLLFYVLSVFYPIEESLRLSFMSWNGIGNTKFVGLQNYANMLTDKIFWASFFNNIIYVVIVVLMQLLIGLLVAVLLTYLTRGVNIFRTLYYIPCIITTVAVSQLFRSIYSNEPVGLLNLFFNAVGLENLSLSWLANLKTVLVAVSAPEGWRFIGLYMVIFYSALISIDPELSEAAIVDGASKWVLLWKIKIPMIRPVWELALIMCITGALRGFDIPYLLTNGGPGNASELLSTYMYKKAFSSMQYGYGSSIAVFIVIESLLVVWVIKYVFAKRNTAKGGN